MMKSYANNRSISDKQLVAHLSKLASRGRSFYRQILPGLTDGEYETENGQKLRAALSPGTIIQIAPLSSRLSIPWELLYERPVNAYREGVTKLCDTFQTHGPLLEDCPHHNDGHVICPHSFWGFRYIIEQLPGRLSRGQEPTQQGLPQWIRNKRPFPFTGIVFPAFDLLQNHWQRLRALAPQDDLKMTRLETFSTVERFFKNRDERPNLIYFYAHGGKQNGLAALKVADKMFITIQDLEAWRVKWHKSNPLLVLNACQSADFRPDSFEDMIQALFRHGASGVIGTQCTIYESLVNLFMPKFLSSFFKQVPAGEALFNARKQLMWKNKDPRGLAYSLFAAAELKLAEAVNSGTS